MTADLSGLRFNPTHDGIAYAMAQKPRLLAFADSARLVSLADAHRAAQEAGQAAASLPVPAATVAEDVQAALLAGDPVDAADIVERLAASSVAATDRDRAVSMFKGIEETLRRDIAYELRLAEEDAWLGLTEQLDDVLARAETALTALGGVLDPAAAMDAGKVEEHLAARAVAADYAELRAAHLDLLRAHDAGGFPNGSDQILWAFYAGIGDVAPEALRGLDRTDRRSVLTAPAQDPRAIPHATGSLDHLAWVIEHREALEPRIGTVEDASSPSTPLLPSGSAPAPREPGRLSPGSPRYNGAMALARRAGADRIADERRDIAAFGDPAR